MVKKAAERRLIKFLFLAIDKSNPLFFGAKFQMESNHYEMKVHFQTSFIFSLDIS